MELVLDFLCIAALVLIGFGHRKHALFSSGAAVVSYALALTLAILVSVPLGNVVDQHLVSPPIQTSAANDIADMYSAEHKGSAQETLEGIPMEELLSEQSTSFVKLAGEFQQTPDALAVAYQKDGIPGFLTALTGGMSFAVSRTISFIVLFAAFAVLLRFISKQIESNLPPSNKKKGWYRLTSMLFGLMVGFVAVQAVVLVLTWVVPYGIGSVLFLDNETWQQSMVYRLSPLVRWI